MRPGLSAARRRAGYLAVIRTPGEVLAQFLGMTRDLDGLPGSPDLRDPCVSAALQGMRPAANRVAAIADAVVALLHCFGINSSCSIVPATGDEIHLSGIANGKAWEMHAALVERGTQLILELDAIGRSSDGSSGSMS